MRNRVKHPSRDGWKQAAATAQSGDNMITMSSRADVGHAIALAEAILPGSPAADGAPDPRWQAMIHIAEFIESDPDAVWCFAARWGKHVQTDLRAAVATCQLEHLLERHFEMIFPRVRQNALRSVRFASTFNMCWSLGQSKRPESIDRIERLKRELWRKRRL
jgi:hypothetical protein